MAHSDKLWLHHSLVRKKTMKLSKKLFALLFLQVICLASWVVAQKTGASSTFQPASTACDEPSASGAKTNAARPFTGIKGGTSSYANGTILVFFGNSIIAAAEGQPANGPTSLPQQVAALFPNVRAVHNLGHPGYRSWQLTPLVATEIAPLVTAGTQCYAVVLEITNDMADGATPERVQDVYDNYVELCETVKAAGCGVIGVGTIPRTSTFMACVSGNLESRLQDVEVLLRADHSFADAMFWPRDEVNLATLGAACPTYLPDGIHPSGAAFTSYFVTPIASLFKNLNCVSN